jgi:hypothetical protein
MSTQQNRAGYRSRRYSNADRVEPSAALIRFVLLLVEEMVGAPGFEPGASCAQGRRATRLRYAPTLLAFDSKVLSNLAASPTQFSFPAADPAGELSYNARVTSSGY